MMSVRRRNVLPECTGKKRTAGKKFFFPILAFPPRKVNEILERVNGREKRTFKPYRAPPDDNADQTPPRHAPLELLLPKRYHTTPCRVWAGALLRWNERVDKD